MKSAQEIGEIAKRAGHEVVLRHREPPEGIKGFTKYWWECTCGDVQQKKSRAKRPAVLWAVAHVAKVAAEVDEEVARSGVADYRLKLARVG